LCRSNINYKRRFSMKFLIERRQPASGSGDWVWPANTHRVLRQVFSRRSIHSPEELDRNLARLRPINQFASLEHAVDLLCKHRSQRVVIVGDFDADGATSTALMYLCLKKLSFSKVEFFLPDRFNLGYGLTVETVDRVCQGSAAERPSLLITVDNGITSIDGVGAARAQGVDVLITDHHLPGERAPNANAIVNPNIQGDTFSGKYLAGVGVVFYLLAALGQRLGEPGLVASYLDLVALGTVADLVPLDQSNRILIYEGLLRIQAGRCRPGIRALCRVAEIRLRSVTSSSLGFKVAPRLNAAGRLEDMTIGVRCLVTEDEDEALELAHQLDKLNYERRDIERRMRTQAEELVDTEYALGVDGSTHIVCLFRHDWHEGVVGLIASKIKERCYRPVIAFAPSKPGVLKGSGRSIPGFHLRDALANVDRTQPGLIERFGGHAMAAGLTLKSSALGSFQVAMEAEAQARMDPEMLSGRILTDGELGLEDFSVELATILRDAGPWGQGFPEPCFDGIFDVVNQRIVGDAHLKITLKPVDGSCLLDAIAWNRTLGEWDNGARVHVVYRLEVNEFFKTPTVQLMVDHIEMAC